MKVAESASASPPLSRAPANGLKLMLLIAFVIGFAVAYGQWQRAQRSSVIHAQIAPLTIASPPAAVEKK